MKLRIGSRGSQLALWQANHIAELLRIQGHEVEIEIVKTTGDRLQEVTFAQVGSKGMFTREIEEALAAGRVDLAVHSLKDLPTELPGPFALAATPVRVDPRDVLVSVKYTSLAELPKMSRVGTSSQRRRALLKALRPDLRPQEFRGNVDTRLRKLAEGQGEATIEAVAFLDHADTRFAVTAERAALAALGGGCQVPIGIHCRPSIAENESDYAWWEIFGVVASPDSGNLVRVHLHAPRQNADPVSLGRETAEMLLAEGAGPLLTGGAEPAGGAA